MGKDLSMSVLFVNCEDGALAPMVMIKRQSMRIHLFYSAMMRGFLCQQIAASRFISLIMSAPWLPSKLVPTSLS